MASPAKEQNVDTTLLHSHGEVSQVSRGFKFISNLYTLYVIQRFGVGIPNWIFCLKFIPTWIFYGSPDSLHLLNHEENY